MKGNRSKNRGHRARVEIDFKELERLCQWQATEEEIADWFNCSVDTIQRRVREHYGISFAELFKRRRVMGLISIRRNMFRLSAKSSRMCIFLATNLLKMSDKHLLANPPGESFRTHDTTDAKGKLVSALDRLSARIAASRDTEEP